MQKNDDKFNTKHSNPSNSPKIIGAIENAWSWKKLGRKSIF